MKQHRSIRTALRIALAAGLSAALGVPVAFAQGNAPSPAQLSKVEVTGTRIKRTSLVTAQPILHITHQEIEESGLKSIPAILNRLTSFKPGVTLGATGSGSGSSANLYYVGGSRTLVLLDGRRLIAGFGGRVDLNQIPVSIIDHIAVLKSGASAIYGSDAIAGVINIITKKNFNGAEASAYYGIDNGPETGYWDGQTQHYDFTLGHSSDVGHFLFDASYRTDNSIPDKDRDSTNRNARLGVTRGSLETPQGTFRFYAPGSGSGLTEPNPPATFTGLTLQQCPDKQLTQNGQTYYIPYCFLTIKKGTNGQSPSDYRPFTRQDRYIGPLDAMSTYNELDLYSSGSYDLAPWVTGNFSILYNRRQSHSHGGYAGLVLNHSGLTIAADNPYNPFGFKLSTSEPIEVAPGVTLPNLESIERRNLEYGLETSTSKDTTLRLQLGFSGDFNLGQTAWSWNTDFIYSTYTSKGYAANGVNGFTTSLATSPDCQQHVGCVPLNVFGGQGVNGTGSLTPAMVAYTSTQGGGTGQTEKDVRILDVGISSSDIFDLPGGPLGFAAGYQHRNVGGRDAPTPRTLYPYRSNPRASSVLQGDYSVDAFYGEINVPIVSHLPGAYYLGTDAATRYSDYSTFGGTVNSRVGVKYQPISDLVLRGTYAEGFRSPTIGQFFTSPHRIPSGAGDPCSNYTAPGTSPAVVKNCKAAGVPPTYVQTNTSIPILASGDPTLGPETSVAKTAGIIYSPSFVPGLSLNGDYFHIKLTNLITAIYVGGILDFCYIDSHDQFCPLIHRRSNGTIRIVDAPVFNIGGREVAGYDLGLDYKLPSTPFGDFTIHAKATHINLVEDIFTGNVTSVKGSLGAAAGVPGWKANLTLNYDYGPFSAAILAHYIGGFNGPCSDYLNGTSVSLTALGFCTHPNYKENALSTFHRGSLTWYDVHLNYALPWNVDVSVGVNNIFGKEPAGGITGGSYSEYLGGLDYGVYSRYLYGQVTVKF